MKIIAGSPDILGFSLIGNRANFAVFSSHATQVILGLFQDGNPIKEISMLRSKDIWHIGIEDPLENLEYSYRCEGPQEHFYNPEIWLIDPYAKIVHLGRAVAKLPPPFDWEGDQGPQIPKEDLIIYEMHVRGFTKHPSSGVKHPGTYLGIIEKIPYLKKLGINAVELMPIFGFDPPFLKRINPRTGEKLINYWGYDPLHFFYPMDWYAKDDPIFEFKTMVKELHKNGIEVILDVVYNHTGEENDLAYYVHFRGLDNCVYYLLDQQGKYLNYSGCWNTVNTNHPVVTKFILDSLRYWVEEMHVDGFRFDLASIFTRDPMGKPMAHPPILEEIRKDPILSRVKLIAEAWDAAGLYQLGAFPKWGDWSEWNGRYRDVARRFLKGAPNKAGVFANALFGSEMIYASSQTPLSSVNFITAHDGYSLRDLVSYEQKHNLENGENNRDGNNQNDSWNCGVEGETANPVINALRERQMRNFFLALFLSQGIPMMLMGDEYGHTRKGNNNPYCQDNELNWFLWDQMNVQLEAKVQPFRAEPSAHYGKELATPRQCGESPPFTEEFFNEKIFGFVSSLIDFRKKHKPFRHTKFLLDEEVNWFTDWSENSRLVAYQLKGSPSFYIAFNANDEQVSLALPKGPWKVLVNTSEDWIFHTNSPPLLTIDLLPYSALLAIQE